MTPILNKNMHDGPKLHDMLLLSTNYFGNAFGELSDSEVVESRYSRKMTLVQKQNLKNNCNYSTKLYCLEFFRTLKKPLLYPLRKHR